MEPGASPPPFSPLSEIHYPIDTLTRKPKGFAFVTFMFPEHAVKAYVAVDGQVFQGRMQCVLPSTIRKEASEDADVPSSSYKKKASEDKACSSRSLSALCGLCAHLSSAARPPAFPQLPGPFPSVSSHNWNTLFMGPNAVADAIVQKYSATKSKCSTMSCLMGPASSSLSTGDQGHCGRALALWETQLVQEVRRFLIDNGVSLDSFSQAAEKRSKTVILAKNLPAGTLAAELQETFGHFGSLGCVLLCEGGVTAIVEFLEPLEARKAFRHLAYSKFHHVPLYLEWAPLGIFSSTAPQGKEPKKHLRERTWWSQKPARTGVLLSMGFGFVEYQKPEQAQRALKQLQASPDLCPEEAASLKQTSSKILVRKIPFQADRREIRELFRAPKKKPSVVLDGILKQLEDSDREGDEQTLQL
ncbi:Hypothetical predicted protein [Marmota monax]|uniref:RRM domain-containing protein n=1 Tax=Marmota monax TaxID=9995 RepID=A0A5E4CWJ0_MARMO|nr:Hypothetical predicted protein [Marmota monax]